MDNISELLLRSGRGSTQNHPNCVSILSPNTIFSIRATLETVPVTAWRSVHCSL